MLFFAEDVFGRQFAIGPSDISCFDLATGVSRTVGRDLEEWADWVLEDYRTITGYPLAHEWQLRRGKLQFGRRLAPVIPFAAGGDYTVENLVELDALEAFCISSSFRRATKDLAPGDRARILLPERRRERD